MSLDPRLVKESFAQIEPVLDQACAYFYGLLFSQNPRLRTLFPPAMDVQRDRLFLALARIACSADSPESLEGFLGGLGREHRKYGVTREHYAPMGAALVATIRKFAAGRWNTAIEQAWTAAFDLAAATMIKAAEEDACSAPPWWIAEVVGHELRTPDIAVLTLRPEQPLPYTAGQHLTVQTARWPRIWRPYSIANAPRADGTLRLHVRAVPGGWVSGTLVRATRPGDTLLLGAAHGTMTPDPGTGGNLLLVAGGTGLAPVKAIVERLAGSGRARPTRLVFGARTASELYDLADLRRLESEHSWLTVTPVVSADPAPGCVHGTVVDALEEICARSGADAAREACLAGPAEMVMRAAGLLRERGFAPGRIHHDLLDRGLAPAPPPPVVGAARPEAQPVSTGDQR